MKNKKNFFFFILISTIISKIFYKQNLFNIVQKNLEDKSIFNYHSCFSIFY